MTELFKFMSESPILTIFLAILILPTIVSIFKYIAYAIRGNPNWDDEDDE